MAMKYGGAMRILRVLRQKSQVWVEKEAGLKEYSLDLLEGGEESPTLEDLERVCGALSVSPAMLFLIADEDTAISGMSEQMILTLGSMVIQAARGTK